MTMWVDLKSSRTFPSKENLFISGTCKKFSDKD